LIALFSLMSSECQAHGLQLQWPKQHRLPQVSPNPKKKLATNHRDISKLRLLGSLICYGTPKERHFFSKRISMTDFRTLNGYCGANFQWGTNHSFVNLGV
jgi:hypothetical protein